MEMSIWIYLGMLELIRNPDELSPVKKQVYIWLYILHHPQWACYIESTH